MLARPVIKNHDVRTQSWLERNAPICAISLAGCDLICASNRIALEGFFELSRRLRETCLPHVVDAGDRGPGGTFTGSEPPGPAAFAKRAGEAFRGAGASQTDRFWLYLLDFAGVRLILRMARGTG